VEDKGAVKLKNTEEAQASKSPIITAEVIDNTVNESESPHL
jgi:hypothetical protein